MLASNAELSRRLDELESKCDRQFKVVFDAIRKLMSPPVRDRTEIGFRSSDFREPIQNVNGRVNEKTEIIRLGSVFR